MSEILKMDKITKIYPGGVVANYQVDFSLQEGEIHALVGENGAGKSTLMKILFGMQKQTEGKIYLRGKEINMNSSQDALELGIGMVHQHFMLVPSLTVAENIVLGHEIKKGIFLDKTRAIEATKELSEKYNLPINPKNKVQDISVSQKQKVEILKALYRGAKILILDEPTAVLTPQEIEELFEQLMLLKKSGHTIIFISHKLHEIKKLCDRLTIMRDGLSVGVHNVNEVSEDDISRLMVGRDVKLEIDKAKAQPKEVLLRVDGINYINDFGKAVVKNVSFSVRKGEIVGIAGVEGNGQSEIIEIITGLKKATKGKVLVHGKEISNLSVREIRELGMAHIPEDRMHTGIAPNMSIEENFISEKYRSEEFSKNGYLLDNKKISDLAKRLIRKFNVKTDSEKTAVKGLSGGNIQKVVVGREFSSDTDLLIVNQPTRGIDVGAIEFIRKMIVKMRDEGNAILLVSADLNEVMTLSDSLIVMNSGEIVGYFPDASKVMEKELGLYMLGVNKQSEEEIRRAVNE
ncbi:ABC transporter ATP-binding protein [Paramaledivibacter caminithermalis]|jgi:simple sugar transport system ATP-binding protein|uniref:Simple sugar transport system ATP-binding protein n=1 Tax=Paramaledivibacter caminithermalis (strain DSM 15212 / CIP 107654 / DViRD3) TaxID=1121301 RepID=A0A1M6MWZ9_PARC5|nr:ABC transporter ATP-binding protein [Paramaledivibacter caminithermalis]SHJ88011.1 simple sugar transport system ATP-binding protein [Paramaledivibacter caminithermalis DSM 15212]